MIHLFVTPTSARLATKSEQAEMGSSIQSRWDWATLERAQELATQVTEAEGKLFIATDAGTGVSPRFDVIEAPRVGDEISYSFNGDTTPDGKIISISKSLRLIISSTGSRYYRKNQSGCWQKGRMWSMVTGHIEERNPHF